MTKKNDDLHVVPSGARWKVTRPGTSRASHTAPTQAGAFEKARRQATREGRDVAIHSRTGQIRKKHTYGKRDPHPPKG